MDQDAGTARVDWTPTPKLTPPVIRAAAITIAAHAHNHDDLAHMLAILGIKHRSGDQQ